MSVDCFNWSIFWENWVEEPSAAVHVVSITTSDNALRHEGWRPVQSGSTRETAPPPTELNRFFLNQVNFKLKTVIWLTPYEPDHQLITRFWQLLRGHSLPSYEEGVVMPFQPEFPLISHYRRQ